MKKLSFTCACLMIMTLMVVPVFAQDPSYQTDVLELGNPGGWTSSLKTFNTTYEIEAGETLEVDIWLTDAPGNAFSGGCYVDFSGYTDKIAYVSSQRYDNTGGELPGPWQDGAGNTIFEVGGTPGTLALLVASLGSVAPDGDGDIIIGKVTFECLVSGFAEIEVTTVAEISPLWVPTPPWDDSAIIGATLTLEECQDHADCIDGNYCNGDETCVAGACVPGVNPCPPDEFWCNGDEGCDEGSDQCIPGEPRCQDDGLFCNGDESCDEDNDQCEQINIPCLPDDGDPCTDDCDEPTDSCFVCNATGTDDPCCLDSPACETAEVCLVEFSDFYVDGTGGDNLNDGLSPGTAWKTITHALNQVPIEVALDDNNRATVHVAASTYDTVMGSGDAETFPLIMVEYVSLLGAGYGDTIIDAGGDVNPLNNVIMFLQEDYIQHVTIDGFTIMGGYAYGGGGIMVNWANPVISNCNITGNIAYGMNGGGIYLKRSNAIIFNCIIADNQAPAQRGGGISCGNQSHPIITNCTIVNNLAGSLEWEGGGGIYASDNSNPTITNCIFWGNEGDDPTTPEDETEILARDGSGIVVNYSCIDGGWSGSGTGNTDQDPLFRAPDDYNLMLGSSCIESANSDGAPENDIDGTARYDACFIPDTGVGPFTYYDRGAIEYQGDSDGDGILDDADGSCTVGDNPCGDGATEDCDDNCLFGFNPGQEDDDSDAVGTICDNCPIHSNGPAMGTCTENTPLRIVSNEQYCIEDSDCDPGEFCEKSQADTYPTLGNGIGDACDCEGNFNCDLSVDGLDATLFLEDFNKRLIFLNPCTNLDPCNGDFNCDSSVVGEDALKFIEDWNKRLAIDNPCPACDPEEEWCIY